MKILVVGLVDYRKVSGGVLHQSALVKHMLRAGHQVTLLAPATGNFANLAEEIRPHLVATKTWRGIGIPPVFDTLVQLREIVRQIKKNKPDVIYMRSNLFTLTIGILGRVCAVPVITEHNSWQAIERAYRGHSRILIAIERCLQSLDCRIASASRAVTAGIRDLLIESGCANSRIEVIGNGADPEAFKPIQREAALRRWNLDPSFQYIGFIGSLTPWHGVHNSIEAMHLLLPQAPNIKLVIFGDGPDRSRLEQLVQRYSLGGCVKFFGAIPLSDANSAINCFDIALAPFSRQLYEKVGVATIKLGDYAAAGRPLIASDLPGIRELLSTGWPVLVPPDDPRALADSIKQLFGDSEQLNARGVAARNAAEGPLNWNAITQQVIDLMQETIKAFRS